MDVVIEVQNLTVKYGRTEAIQNISCQIHKGDFVGLVGPNGGGKTTLIKAILGLISIHSGHITLLNQEVRAFGDFHKIGYLPQKHDDINQLLPASAGEVVTLGVLSSKKWPKRVGQQDRKKVDQALSDLNILDLRGQMLSELSGGGQQKVLLARALVSNPEILILDEPSTALDPSSREHFFTLLKDLNEKAKTTVILITHDTGYIGKYANKLLYLDRKLVFYGKITDFCPSGEVASCFGRSERHIIWHQHD